MFDGWAVALNGVILTGSCDDPQAVWDATGCSPAVVLDVLDETPDMPLPGVRDEDVTFPQRDGVKHFNDWYLPRIITLHGTVGPIDACSCAEPDNCECLTVRGQVSALTQAFKRACCDTEAVIYPPCDVGETVEERAITGPFGVIGRPRSFQGRWVSRAEQIFQFTARFDAVDQRAYVLDDCGTPGYTNCADVDPGTETLVACYDEDGLMCYGAGGICYTTVVPGTEMPAGDILVGGTEKVYPTFTLYPNMANPRIVNITTGEYISYAGIITDTAVQIDTENGTAFDSDGNTQTHRLGGNIFMGLDPGNYQLRVFQTGDYPTDPEDEDHVGFMQICWRDTIVML